CRSAAGGDTPCSCRTPAGVGGAARAAGPLPATGRAVPAEGHRPPSFVARRPLPGPPPGGGAAPQEHVRRLLPPRGGGGGPGSPRVQGARRGATTRPPHPPPTCRGRCAGGASKPAPRLDGGAPHGRGAASTQWRVAGTPKTATRRRTAQGGSARGQLVV